ncbi:MAG: aminomethyltransferase [Pirellulaceae bacterium]|nr:MAG: aminomethyltransferase [Pirellulaceae bacterium]
MNFSARSSILRTIPNGIRLDIVGKDAKTVAHNLTTNDVRSLGPGEAVETFLTNVRGHVIAHVLAVGGNDCVSLIGMHPQPEKLQEHIDRYIIREDAEVRHQDNTMHNMLLFGVDLSALREVVAAVGAGVESVSPGETPLVVGFPVGESTAWMSLPSAMVDPVTRQLAQMGVDGEVPRDQWEWMRIAARWPQVGAEIVEKTLPQELDRDRQAISFTKGCYLGQETVARLDALGQVQKKLVLLVANDPVDVSAGDEITSGGQVVGRITSAASVEDGRPIMLAYVKRGYFEGQHPLQVHNTEVSFPPG